MLTSLFLNFALLISLDVTSPKLRQQNLLEYVARREDLSSSEKAAWESALRLTFGGKSLKDGQDEGVTVAKSVIAGAIFFGIKPKEGAAAAYEAYHDTYRFVPPPIAINYQLLAFQGRKPKASSRELAFRFPKYFNEELAPDLVVWWTTMLEANKISAAEAPEIRRALSETRVLMRPMLLERLWQACQIEARLAKAKQDGAKPEISEAEKALATLTSELSQAFAGVAQSKAVYGPGTFYERYRALATELNASPKPIPKIAPPDKPIAARPPPVKKATPRPKNADGFATYTGPSHEPIFEPGQAIIAAPIGRPLLKLKGELNPSLEKNVATWLGTPYVWGGTTRKGVDCSGFVRAVFAETFSVALPRNSRAQNEVGANVTTQDLKPGDLVFFDTLDQGRVTHVGIYLGNGFFAHAGSKGVGQAELMAKYHQRAFLGAKRLFEQTL